MSEITIRIDGKSCKAKEGEFILNIARREEIFIPAICYLTGCSPTLACRICLVEADGKRVYSCNAKAKEGMEVITNNDEIAAERKAIMQVYDVNHPLQCGVCDQSGECELQNYTMITNVDKQEYAIADMPRPVYDWGLIKYDAGLCIVCEKCVTVCKDSIGDNVLKTVPRGGDTVDKSLKESMPKDAYTMWNKLQKSIIGTVSEDNTLSCQTCGECISVCPVGALVSSDFQYTSNAWELKKIPAANPHSSDCSLIYYEVKHGDSKNYGKKIFRVTNEAHYSPIGGATRFGFDFENRVSGKDRAVFEKVVDFIENSADTIRFTSVITNEEALILQKIKEKYNLKLINEDARKFQNFLNIYSQVSGTSLYSGDLKSIKSSNFVVSVGCAVRYDAPAAGFAFNNALKMNKGAGIYFHPMGDSVVDTFAKTMMSVQHQVGSEEHVLAFILDYFSELSQEQYKSEMTAREAAIAKAKEAGSDLPDFDTLEAPESLPKEIKDIVSDFTKESVNLPEDFDKAMVKMLAKKDRFALIVGEDLYTHAKADNLAKLTALIEKYTPFNVTIIPSQTNTLGVSLICDLDSEAGSQVLGYNAAGNCVLSALGDGDLDMPALNQQEGTFTNLDKRVVPTNAALDYSGYVLNDIANALGFEEDQTINYTDKLPTERGFSPLEFDLMPNFFDNGGNELRGYMLNNKAVDASDTLDSLEDVKNEEGMIAYRSNPINQFNYFTNRAHQLKTEGAVYVSSDFLERQGLDEGDSVEVKSATGAITAKLALDEQLTGEIIYLGTFDKALDTEVIFADGSRFSTVTIRKV
ncbi:MAG: NADH-quinone oxidoreductase subunit G [Epsilonproteobacteria bacterium]|nr:NADH-quinone oxidoreductase subunit G [Campylobacterota bacterium]